MGTRKRHRGTVGKLWLRLELRWKTEGRETRWKTEGRETRCKAGRKEGCEVRIEWGNEGDCLDW